MRGPLRDFSKAGLDEVERLALLAPGTIPRLCKQFQNGKLHWTRIWSLVVLGHYLTRAEASVGFELAVDPPARAEDPLSNPVREFDWSR